MKWTIVICVIWCFAFTTGQIEADAEEVSDVPNIPEPTSPPSFNTIEPNGDDFSRESFTSWLIAYHKDYPRSTSDDYPGYDGWYNNVGNPELGAIDTPLLRYWPADYEDHVYQLRQRTPRGQPRPNPLELSDQLLSGPIGSKSRTGKNALMVFFGQHVVEEILDAQRPACPPEYINIKIPKDHRYEKVHTEMPVLRTRYDARTGQSPNNPRQQLNEITPFLDGGLIYGTTKAWSDYLRLDESGKLVKDGLLASSYDGRYPAVNTIRLPMANPPPPARHAEYVRRHETEPVTRYFKLGNPRGNENPFLLTFGVIWFRWHNVLAENIKRLNPNWSGEKIFNEARKWVIATQQSIVVYDWLPQWLGEPIAEYRGYNPFINPQIEQMFQSAAFRFGHTLVPAGVYLRNPAKKGCGLNGPAMRTCNNFWLPQNGLWNNSERMPGLINIEKLLMGMAVQLAEEEDHKIVEDLRGNVFGPLEFSRRDLMALNIQRGRDHGVPDFNTARTIYNLLPVTNFSYFEEFSKDKDIVEKLRKLYKDSYDDIDLWVGGILETQDGPGRLFRAIIKDQFERIRNGDRYWFENNLNGLFTDDQIGRLKMTKFKHIILSVTDPAMVGDLDIPPNAFKVPEKLDDIPETCRLPDSPVLELGNCHFWNQSVIPCWHAPPVDISRTENCTELGTYDYFDVSESAFLLTFCSTALFFLSLVVILLVKMKKVQEARKVKLRARLSRLPSTEAAENTFSAHEWVGFSTSNKPILIYLCVRKRQLQVRNHLGFLVRALDFGPSRNLILFVPHESCYMLLRVDHNYDLVLKFESIFLKCAFLIKLETFLVELNVQRETVTKISTFALLRQAVTLKVRQKKLEQFFRVVFAQAFDIAHCENEMLQIDSTVAKEVIYTELTILEFAEALTMRPDSEFIRKIFNLIDTDKNGFISFREFIDMLVLFLKGTAEDKLKLMFDMYDINGVGHLKREDFGSMLKSFMETVNADISDSELQSLIHSMMEQAQIAGKETIDLQDFKNILGEFNDKLNYMELEFNVSADGTSRKFHAGMRTFRSKFIGEVQKTVESLYADPNDLRLRVGSPRDDNDVGNSADIVDKDASNASPSHPWVRCIANNQLEIFWGFLYTVVLWVFFFERFYYYSVLREHAGLRRIMDFGVSMTRGAASAMMFAYSSMLVTMCHNTITILRDTALQFYIPFDAAIAMHKYIACWALFFTLVHIIGHGFNFYYISSQTADDLTCLFRNNFHATHEFPKFQYWVWGTMTGVTAMLLTFITGIIFICSLPLVRSKIYKWFEYGHCLYPVFYLLTFMHGSGRLIQEPQFHYFFLGPATLFTIDKIFTAMRRTIEIPLLKVEVLPSDVTCLIFQKPLHFQYKAGQWVRISCPDVNTREYHPFTLSSAPHEPVLSVHIRAVGPWTNNIRNKLDPTRNHLFQLPKIHVDGPYGESHQNWNKYDISIMIGSGIGVTPFASILKDIVQKSRHHHNFGTQKVYFVWVTRKQKQFEWMVDIIRGVERADVNHIVSVHIFITQFYQKFDLRTILLYICERHFQKISNKSLFTGLKAVTHFGRPNFSAFFTAIERIHPNNNTVGVFSCGTPTVTRAVDNACQNLNSRTDTQTLFRHHFKNF